MGPFDRRRLLERNYIDACAAFRREVWEQNGGYDPDMPVWTDWDFWLGACRRGWVFEYVPEITFEYRVRNDSMSRSIHGQESALVAYVVKKHASLYGEALLDWRPGRMPLRRVARLALVLAKNRLKGCLHP